MPDPDKELRAAAADLEGGAPEDRLRPGGPDELVDRDDRRHHRAELLEGELLLGVGFDGALPAIDRRAFREHVHARGEPVLDERAGEAQREIFDLAAVGLVCREGGAVFGDGWGRLSNRDGVLGMLYGGIDSKEVTERAADPSGAMGAIQRILANDVACKQTALDFSRAPSDRRLFPHIEPDVVPGSAEADAQIRRAIVHLHQRLLGRSDAPDSAEVTRTFNLFAGILSDAAGKNSQPRRQS